MGQPGGALILTGDDTLAHTGAITIDGGAGSNNHTAPPGGSLIVTGMLTNAGRIELLGGSASATYGAGGLGAALSVSGTLANTGSLLLGSASQTAGYHSFGQSSQVSVSGVLMNTGFISAAAAPTGSAPLSGTLITNTGTIITSGSIDLQGGAANPSNYGRGSDGATLVNSGILSNTGSLRLGGAGGGLGRSGYSYPGTGACLVNAGTLSNTGLIELRGGAPGSYDFYQSAGGGGASLQNSGVLINTASILIDGGDGGHSAGLGTGGQGGDLFGAGALTNTGAILVQGGAGSTGAFSVGGAGGALQSFGVVTNAGQITLGTGGLSVGQYAANASGGAFYIYGTTTDSGTITVDPATFGTKLGDNGGLLVVGGTLILANGTIDGFGAVRNAGAISGTGDLQLGEFANTGVLTAAGGMLSVTATIEGTGMLSAGANATLSLAGAVAPTQTISLDPTALLELTTPLAGVDIVSPSGGHLELPYGGAATLNANDTHLTVSLFSATSLTLSRMGFITAIGSAQHDTITALAANQTLTGGGGADTLIGAAATGDTFRDTASGLNGDTITGFAGTDVIDVTDLAPGPALSLGYEQQLGQGTLTLSEAGKSATITLLGSFTQGAFQTASDLHGGVLIGLTPSG